MWADCIVPVAVEIAAPDTDGVHLGVADLDAGGIGGGIDLALDLQPGIGGRGRNELDDGLVADERSRPPILGNEREEAMLDLVPFARAGREMADGDDKAELGGQDLQLALPQPQTDANAAAAIGGEQQPPCMREARPAHRLPPAPDAANRRPPRA